MSHIPSKRAYQQDPHDGGLPYDDDEEPAFTPAGAAHPRPPPLGSAPSRAPSSHAALPVTRDWRSAFLDDEQPDPRDRFGAPSGHRRDHPPPPHRDAHYASSSSRAPYAGRDTRERSREPYISRERGRDGRSREPVGRGPGDHLDGPPPAQRLRTRSPEYPARSAASSYHHSPPRGDHHHPPNGDRGGYVPRGPASGPYGGGDGHRGGWAAGRGGAAPNFRGGRGDGYQPYAPGGGRAPPSQPYGEQQHDRSRPPPHQSGVRSPPLSQPPKVVEPPKEEVIEVLPDELDEEEALAERRRRRAQIMEKFSGAASDTSQLSAGAGAAPAPAGPLAAVLGSGTSAVASPVPSGLNSVNVPGTPTLSTTPNGAFDLSKHGLATSSAAAGTGDAPLPPATDKERAAEISAADYDPAADGRAEEVRRMQAATEGGAKGDRAADIIGRETKEEMRAAGVKVEAEAAPAAVAEAAAEDDDSDDDMFAVDVVKPKRPTKPKTDVPMITHALPAVAQSAATLSDNWDDADGYYRIILGEVLDGGRYHVFSNLGKGMFSAVVKARVVKPDPRTGEVVGQEVAIKIIRSQESMYKAGQKEIQILNKLREADPDDKKHIVRLERTFEHRGHLCMVFESLSMNLRDVIKRFGKDLGLNLKAVRAYSHQMFLALSLLKKCSTMHADIKPDNILVTENKSVLKVCDLGSASHESENEITPYLVSRFYRAPEIILGLPYDCALDVWSIGCTLYELYTGKILFPGRTNNQMLLLMQELKGKINHRMIKKAQFGNVHFDEGLNFLSCEIDKSTGLNSIKVVQLSKPVRDLRARLLPSPLIQSRMRDDELKFLQAFIDLLDRCLQLDPAKRITPKEALAHPFLRGPGVPA